MKSFITGFSILIFTFFVTSLLFAGIKNSEHDFSSMVWNTSAEICIVCHTPHNTNTNVLNAPLWNHNVTLITNYSLYSSDSLDAILGQPTGISKLCLSCHDGTVAVDSFGGAAGSSMITGDALIGINLNDDHPISFTYDTTLSTIDNGLFDPMTTNSGIGGTIAEDFLFDNQLQCSSCHDVHNKAGIANLLKKSNAGSDLCLTCHDK